MVKRIGGALWQTPTAWALLRSRRGCPICRRGRPRDIIATLSSSWVTAPRRAPLPGYVAVVAKRHVVEPYELPKATGRAFWDDVMLVAKCLTQLFSSVKMNYEIHGNTVPHLHVHLYPRYRDDPYLGGPIDPRRATFARSREDLLRVGRVIQNAQLSRRRGGSHTR
jgi:diadenosine tetraphosphate (Ap4A) HIT family hydrolase